MSDLTSAQKKLIFFLKKRHPTITDNDIPTILNSFKRFVNLTRAIYTEPQASISYLDRIEGNAAVKDRVFTTTIDELKKVKSKSSEPIADVLKKFHRSVTKKKYE